MIIKLLVGIAISATFLFFTLKGIDVHEVWAGLRDPRYVFLLPIVFVFILTQTVRSLRWGVILSPIKSIGQKKLFPIASVGYLAIIVAPMRLGEIVRPFLINAKESVPLGSGLASILVERAMDLLMLFGFLFFILAQVPLPAWLARVGSFLFGIILLEALFIILFMLFPDKIQKVIGLVTKRLPRKIARGSEFFIANVATGFRVFSNFKKFLQVFFLSLAVWVLSAIAVYLLFLFQRMPLGILEALTVATITSLGVGLPAAPGLIGNFQFACMLSLSLWGITKNQAFVFAMVYYMIGIGINVLLGLIFLPFMNIPFWQMLKYRKKGAYET